MTQPSYHTPVMLNEAVEHLVTVKDGIYVDGTLGGGGHAEKICSALIGKGMLIGIDADADAISAAGKKLQAYSHHVRLVNDNTAHIAAILHSSKISTIHGLLLDLGVSSYQLDEAQKGFSFRSDVRLDMRMDRRQPLDAYAVINSYDETELADVIFHYGEERFSRKIARRIVEQRMKGPVETTGRLAAIVESAVGGKFAVKSLARVFQAIRIEVNDELHRLKAILSDVLPFIEAGGRIVVISYHSLEDRIVKTFFNECAATFIPSGNKFQPDIPRHPELKIITKKPMLASEDEQKNNPRSRSAKMRVAERTERMREA